MKRVWWQLLGFDEFTDADGTIDRPCYGLFPARDTAEVVAGFFGANGLDVEVVEVSADWSMAVS